MLTSLFLPFDIQSFRLLCRQTKLAGDVTTFLLPQGSAGVTGHIYKGQTLPSFNPTQALRRLAAPSPTDSVQSSGPGLRGKAGIIKLAAQACSSPGRTLRP